KLNTSLSSPNIGHRVVARFLETGAYDRHLRRLRNQIKNQMSAMSIAVANSFPKDTRVTFPRGGMVMWIELNKAIDTMKIYQEARLHGISIMPGRICSSTDRYSHCLRLNCGLKWSTELEQGIAVLGQLIHEASELPLPKLPQTLF
ncbi:MAG: hypothetical protein MI892_07835, partial [Desulfobacterales bacterium]|nr:hypothetical protein [Desulfobacterales bacterium]